MSCNEVLLIGGDRRYPGATSEIFNTSNLTFAAGATANSPRSDHLAMLLDNGDVLLIGGASYYRPLELFVAATRTFAVEDLQTPYGFYNGNLAGAMYASQGNCPSCPAGHKVFAVGGGMVCETGTSVSFDTMIYVPTNMSPPPPSITSVTPATASTGGGTTVTITGANFQQGATASVAYHALDITSTSATQIVGTTHASDAGVGAVTVNNPDAQFVSLANGFTYVFRPAGDSNGDGSVTVGDVFYLINFLFGGGPAPITSAVPGPSTGGNAVTLSLGEPVQRNAH
jgi:IPT/TIG domain